MVHHEDILQFGTLQYMLNLEQKIRLDKLATKSAVLVAGFLFVLKIFVWIQTSSNTIKLSCIDSGFDLLVSTVNFGISSFLLTRQTDRFLYNFDKFAALAALIQSILMSIALVCALCIFDHHHVETGISLLSLFVVTISLALSIWLVALQTKVAKLTGSMIVRADMLHYKTDLLMNFAALVCLSIGWLTGISILDFYCSIGVGLYLTHTIIELIWHALKVLLDCKLAHDYHIPNCKIDVVFTGMKQVIIVTGDVDIQSVRKSLNLSSDAIVMIKH